MDDQKQKNGQSMAEETRTYQRVVDYVKAGIRKGDLHPGDRLPAERELADQLGISRNSVREGLRVLQNIGVISSTHGSGNYISLNFDQTMSEMLGFMYFLKGVDEDKVSEFRWMIEREALPLAIERITPEQKRELMQTALELEAAQSEEERLIYDKRLHQIVVRASGNDFLISNYEALMTFMDRCIISMRHRIIVGMESRNMLEKAHRMLAEGLIEKDLAKSRQALEEHIGYTARYR